ncbi:MAG: cytochrome b5 [Bacillota bacterium]|nr:cytochrome b5 [Bacillota bacterium]
MNQYEDNGMNLSRGDGMSRYEKRETPGTEDGYESLPVFTLEDLAKFNGRLGMPAYVAVNGIVYDVTGYSTWGQGTHYDLVAGTDVTEGYVRCHNHSVLERLNIVGRLVR